MNRRPSGYEGVSAKIHWTDCIKQHEINGISAHSDTFQPALSNWCADVFPVVGQNVGQALLASSNSSQKLFSAGISVTAVSQIISRLMLP